MPRFFIIFDEASLFFAGSCVRGFLFDENVPRLVSLTASLPVSHVTDLGESLMDSDIWTYAREHSLVIVTKDADFSNRIMVSATPPWIIHLRFGNMRRRDFHAFLARIWSKIEDCLS